ncbi:hypothetical protein SGFS_057830 [Streptomyces graminofaciens]|uniref:Uncharacterized protein n=1 Tax=Streptomyces graminofaciens TaxID=68212 RepID=A0ABM7FDR1_9ACTN|nr:hypothetical protein SGFS_057830 [Streptomyces graminofaciens]
MSERPEKRRGSAEHDEGPGRDDRGLHSRADDEARTRDLNLGKVALYQLSYVRIASDRLPPIGASISLPDPQQWFDRRCRAGDRNCTLRLPPGRGMFYY